ncbi:MAG TPA: hypothetical protein DEA08_16165, partial [Planctomycetes bacterium]|nr:hypothetical protein [Planctomycetota bacterium]
MSRARGGASGSRASLAQPQSRAVASRESVRIVRMVFLLRNPRLGVQMLCDCALDSAPSEEVLMSLRASLLASALLAGLLPASAQESRPAVPSERADEPYLKNVRQLTFGDERAGEAYFSPDGKRILFQAKRPGQAYYQIYLVSADGKGRRMVSTGKGKTTCAFFHPTDPNLFIYASSHLDARTHKAPPPRETRRYKWDYDDSFDIFLADLRTGEIKKQLTTTSGYDAECSFSPDGKTICFTTRREGKPDAIYLMNADGSDQRPLVAKEGVDCGGPFFSPDGKWVIYRASAKGSRVMHSYMTSVDGKQTITLTRTPRINWAPFFHPSGNYAAYGATAKGSYSDFDIFLVKTDGSFEEVALTVDTGFDGLPAFSPDGKTIAWSSGRGGNPQVFLADFVMPPASAFKPGPKAAPKSPHGAGSGHGGSGGHGGSSGHGGSGHG